MAAIKLTLRSGCPDVFALLSQSASGRLSTALMLLVRAVRAFSSLATPV